MNEAEAKQTVDAVLAIDWPDGIDFRVETLPTVRGWVVHVSILSPAGITDEAMLFKPLNPGQVERLLNAARQLAAMGRGKGKPPLRVDYGLDDDSEPMPDWLRLARLRISACPAGDGPRTLAFEIVQALECEGIPAPAVSLDHLGQRGLVLAWERPDGHSLDITCHSRHRLTIALWGDMSYIQHCECGPDFDSRNGAWYESRFAMDIWRGARTVKEWRFEGIPCAG